MLGLVLVLAIGSSCDHLPFPPGPTFDHVEDNLIKNPVAVLQWRQLVFWEWDAELKEDIATSWKGIDEDCTLIWGSGSRKYVIARQGRRFYRFRYRFTRAFTQTSFDRERANLWAFPDSKIRRDNPF